MIAQYYFFLVVGGALLLVWVLVWLGAGGGEVDGSR